MLKHFEALKNLYKEYLALNEQIKRAVENEAYEELNDMVERKGEVLEGILRQESIVELSEEQRKECISIREKIIAIEEANLSNINVAKDATYSELNTTKKTATLQKAYSFKAETGKIFDASE